MIHRHLLLLHCLYSLIGFSAWADGLSGLRRTEVIYGRKFGTALTLDVLQPAKTNGLGVIWVISGGFYSDHNGINPPYCKALLDEGYTVFAVVHGSQPRFTILEIAEDMHRAVRWIRHHASDYSVRPDRLGVTGSSAGGHLSLTLGTQGHDGDPKAKDPVDRESSRVQAVACFFPPTDFENWGAPGDTQVGVGKVGRQFYGAFGSPSDTLESRLEYGRPISPIHFVTKSMAPTLVIHGEADGLVPIYQAEIFEKKARDTGAVYKLVRLPGKDHGWPGMEKDLVQFAQWFKTHLK
ncbi:MAG: alpha/beta hydrolase [Pedosphaera sp.]|nr:alpha/beta hydrolase [Pedosphaera sp.]